MTPFNLFMDDVRDCSRGPEPWTIARTVELAQEYLSFGLVLKCSLDHDMGACEDCVSKGLHQGDCLTDETTFMNWCPHVMDGTKLVRWMVETGHWPKEKPFVHSANPNGRDRMRALIDQFYGLPAQGPMFYDDKDRV